MNKDYKIVMPGRVVEYFPENQTATLLISGERIFNSATERDAPTDSGLLYNVPVHTASGGGYAVTIPIKPDDTCLILFSQFGYDHWLYNDEDVSGTYAGQPSTWINRKFSIKDGFAIVGLNTIPTAIPNYSADDAQFRNHELTQYLTLHAEGDITLEATEGGMNLQASGDLDIDSANTTLDTGNLDITASATTITSETTHNGTVNMAGNPVENLTIGTASSAATVQFVIDTHAGGGGGGSVGPTGPTGATGSQGPTGPEGPAGPQGEQGVIGIPGLPGAKGQTGDTGPRGGDSTEPGPQGETGAAGTDGTDGATGATGAQGPQGTPGVDSTVPGPQGDTGQQGPQGEQGPQGNVGFTGDTGPQGPQGDTGAIGPQGDTGAQGASTFLGGTLYGGTAHSVYLAVQNLQGGNALATDITPIDTIITGGGAIWMP